MTHLIKMAKLRRVVASDSALRLSLEELREAVKLTPVTFGSENSLVREVMGMMLDTEAELHSRTQQDI